MAFTRAEGTECLREVSDREIFLRMDLLRQKAQRAQHRDQSRESGAGLLQVAGQRDRLHHPEGSKQEGAFLCADAIVGLVAVKQG
jgi:hypothetical protein